MLTNVPTDVFDTPAQFKCSKCGIDMLIAGAYDKTQNTCQGKSLPLQFVCHSCNTIMVPEMKRPHTVTSDKDLGVNNLDSA